MSAILNIKPTLNVKPTINIQSKSNEATLSFPTAKSYKQYDPRTHVYEKADMYIMSDERLERQEWLLNTQEMRMHYTTIDYTPGCERLFVEILSNSSDNVGRSRRAGVNPGKIEIIMDSQYVTVTNYGLPIPIEIHEDTQMYVPEMILGNLLTSSNYGVDRHEAGTNGIGAKATNIFSKEFEVVIFDGIRHLKYEQKWKNNMLEKAEPVITKYNGKTSSVTIKYKMDFARFGYTEYPAEVFMLYARHAADTSFTAKTTVVFNGLEINCANIRDYAKLYFGDAADNGMIHYQWPDGTEVVTKKRGYQVAKDQSIVPLVELIALDTPDEGSNVSFVNCMMTREGGVHVEAAIKAVGSSVVEIINNASMKALQRQHKGKEIDAKLKRAHTVNISDVKPHISVLLSVRVVNPKFTSQSKTALQSPTPKVNIDENTLRIINQWELLNRLEAALNAKQYANMAKTDGKSKRHIKLLKGIDANDAGKKRFRGECMLGITEGDSGAGYLRKFIKLTPNGKDKIGILPMKGKSLNIMNATKLQIMENKEIAELKQMLGLREGYDYMKEENFNTLRYGSLMIMADSDVDGKHIIGLILNFFHCKFPSLLARGYVMYYRTPILRVKKKKVTHKFYAEVEYNKWKNANPDFDTWEHKYYKGLGTSKDKEIADDKKQPRVVHCLYDDKAPDAMRLAFDKKLADMRKEWLKNWVETECAEGEVPEIEMQPISEFVNKELILFSRADVQRSIPRLSDGFKESQRKIIYGTHIKWNISTTAGKKYKEFKVAQFAASVAGNAGYHHGELILGDVIIGMAQDFVGHSNNIPWFTKDGQFGTREALGKDAANPRYSFTRPHKLMAYILRPEHNKLLKRVIDEGKEYEPETYRPIIPMALVNGCNGIGTGFSTFIPCHNPIDIIQWLKLKLQGSDDLPTILPWYRGFKGTIEIIDRRSKNRLNDEVTVTVVDNNKNVTETINIKDTEEYNPEDEMLPDEEDEQVEFQQEENVLDTTPKSKPLLSMATYGNFTESDNKITVTELPIGRGALSYRTWLDSLVQQKKITDYRDLSGDDDVYFEIYGFNQTPTHNNLKLKKTKGLTNMVLLDDNSVPVKYETAFNILEEYYKNMDAFYQQCKEYLLGQLESSIVKKHHKMNFIRAVTNKVIDLYSTENEIKQLLYQLDIPFEIYVESKTRHLNATEIGKLEKEITNHQLQYDTLKNTPHLQLWLDDLNAFEEAYIKYYSKIRKTEQVINDEGNGKKRRAPRKTTVKKKTKPNAPVIPNKLSTPTLKIC